MRPLSLGVLAVASVGVVSGARGQSLVVVAGAIVALVVAAGGIAFVFAPWERRAGVDAVVLVAVGVAGVVLAGVLRDAPGFVIVYLALAGIGLRLPLKLAFAAGAAVFAAMNVAAALAGLSVPSLVSQDIGAVFVFTVGVFTRSARIAQDTARLAQEQAEEVLAQLRASQAALAEAAALSERARLAREIHDVLAHVMSGLVLALDTAQLLAMQGDGGQETQARMLEQVTRAQRMAREGLAEIRSAVSALRGDELPGPALLERLAHDTGAVTGLRTTFIVAGLERTLSAEVGLTLYRTAQEALTNATKYAARNASVEMRLSYEDSDVELVVEDTTPDARARPTSEATAGMTFGGYGLTGMRERAELAGGTLTAGATDHGFRVCLRLPAPASTVGTSEVRA